MAPRTVQIGVSRVTGTEETAVFQRIVIPLDGSEEAERAVPYGQELARRFGAPLHLVRVVGDVRPEDPSPGGANSPLTPDSAVTPEMAAEYLDHVRSWLTDRGTTATTEVRRGEASYEILAVTRAGDLLVMDSRGGGSGGVLLGIVSEVLARRAPCPILLVPPADN